MELVMPSPFDLINSISNTKEDILEDEKDYNSFIVNRGLSYFPDTILYANEMNTLHWLPNRLKYDYLMGSIRKKKRYSKWAKKEKNEDLELIMNVFNYNIDKASSALKILTEEDLQKIRDSQNKGGV